VSALELDGLERLRMSYRVLVRIAKVSPAARRLAAFYRMEF
jgi:hypothetical protein